ncbi:hypothetical protein BKA65DRAFT_18384 [Rhexocercosporidium sp. MPI-PUGE-AT-0058]|nr:hypothetical protein BKA65DRAFT_18384 [Rhexocercosporidium sp. MPI-PUGE-AT-0058]
MSKQEQHQDPHDDTISIADSIQSIPRPISSKINKFVQTYHAISRPFRQRLTFRKPLAFHKFGELPLEVRLLIWETAMVPRVHELHPCSKLYNERMTFRSNSSRAPAIFHINAESRSVALNNYELFDYRPPGLPGGKGILRFYFNPKMDTLLLNSLMGLFIMFMLLEDDDDEYNVMGGLGVMKGWQYVAFDAQRAELISLLSGVAGHAPQPRFKVLFPALKQFMIAFDYNSKGKTRFRTSVWPGENGTRLIDINLPPTTQTNDYEIALEIVKITETIYLPMREYLEADYKDEAGGIPHVTFAKVKRKKFIRGDLRYAFRKTCSFVGLKPRGVFRRL